MNKKLVCHKCQNRKWDKWHLCKMSDLDKLKTEAIEEKDFLRAAQIRDWQRDMRRR